MFVASPKMLAIFIYILVAQSFINKLSIHGSVPLLDFWDELVVAMMGPSILATSLLFLKSWQGRMFFFLLFSYLLVSLFSSMFGITSVFQSIYQFVLDLKYVIIYLYCAGSYRKGVSEDMLNDVFKKLVLANIPLVIIQSVLPGVYDAMFPNGAHKGIFAAASGVQLARTAGIFWFTGLLAVFGTAASAFFASKILSKESDPSDKWYLIASLLVLLSTLSRGEIAGFIIGFGFVYIIFLTNKYTKPIVMVFGIILVMACSVLLDSYISEALNEMGVLSSGGELAPRAAFMNTSISVANTYFPLGAGLGAFGGAAAAAFDSPLFYQYLIAYEWYFDHGLFLCDTYWPKVIAESGFFGAILNALFVIVPTYFCYKAPTKSLAAQYGLWMFAVLFVNSLAAPIYGSAVTLIISSFLIGGVVPIFQRRL